MFLMPSPHPVWCLPCGWWGLCSLRWSTDPRLLFPAMLCKRWSTSLGPRSLLQFVELLCNGIGQATIVETSALWVFPELLRTAALNLVIQCVSRLKFFPVSLHLVKANKCTTWCSYRISIENLGNRVQSILINFDKIQTLLTSFSFVIRIAFWITMQMCALTIDNICTELKVVQQFVV